MESGGFPLAIVNEAMNVSRTALGRERLSIPPRPSRAALFPTAKGKSSTETPVENSQRGGFTLTHEYVRASLKRAAAEFTRAAT